MKVRRRRKGGLIMSKMMLKELKGKEGDGGELDFHSSSPLLLPFLLPSLALNLSSGLAAGARIHAIKCLLQIELSRQF